jgi:hypothetical protein
LKEEYETKTDSRKSEKTKTFVPVWKQPIAVPVLAGDFCSTILAALLSVTPAIEN